MRAVPTYDYDCRRCGRRIEVIHPMREDGPSTCDACGGALRRVLYPAGIIFKGSGFYSTDSRSGSAADKTGGTASSDQAAGAEKAATSSPGRSDASGSPAPAGADTSRPSGDSTAGSGSDTKGKSGSTVG